MVLSQNWMFAGVFALMVVINLIIFWKSRVTIPKDLKEALTSPIRLYASDTAEQIGDKNLYLKTAKKKKEGK